MTRGFFIPRNWLVVFFLLATCGPFPTQHELRADVNIQGASVLEVSGYDPINKGSYQGRVELIPTAAPQVYRFIRVIDYDASVSVEDNRSLSWVWEGTATVAPGGSIAVTVALQKADFVKRRGTLERTVADALPVQVTGHFEPWMGNLAGGFSGPGVSAAETWSSPVASGQQPIFAKQVVELPTHDPLPADRRDSLFLTFSSFHARPDVQPYVNRLEFQNPVHSIIVDATDFDFYQQRPTALRVVDKVVDPIPTGDPGTSGCLQVASRWKSRVLRRRRGERFDRPGHRHAVRIRCAGAGRGPEQRFGAVDGCVCGEPGLPLSGHALAGSAGQSHSERAGADDARGDYGRPTHLCPHGTRRQGKSGSTVVRRRRSVRPPGVASGRQQRHVQGRDVRIDPRPRTALRVSHRPR